MDYGEFVRMLLRRWIENFTRFSRLYEEDFDVSCIFCFCERFLKYTSISQHIGRFLKGLLENFQWKLKSWSLCWTSVSPSAMARCQVFLILRFPPISNLWHLCRSRLIALHTARSSAVTCVSVWSQHLQIISTFFWSQNSLFHSVSISVEIQQRFYNHCSRHLLGGAMRAERAEYIFKVFCFGNLYEGGGNGRVQNWQKMTLYSRFL